MKYLSIVALLFSIHALSLTVVGSGIRDKKILFVPVSVYEATLAVSEPALFVRDTTGTKALDSLKKMKARSLTLKFKRDVSGSKIRESFEAALEANKVADSKLMKQFKEAIQNGGDVKTDENVVIAVDKDKGILTVEQGSKRVEIAGDEAFFQNVFSIWLGTPADSGLETLKTKLIRG